MACSKGALAFLFLVWAVVAVHATRPESLAASGCEPIPEGDWLFDYFLQTEPFNNTLVLMVRNIFTLTEVTPNVFTGIGVGTVSHLNPNKVRQGLALSVRVLGLRDPSTCLISATVYSPDVPINDAMSLTYDGLFLKGDYIGAFNGTTLTTTALNFVKAFLLSDK